MQWQKTIGGSAFDGAGSALSTPDGGFLIAGASNSNISGDKTEDSQGASDLWIVKIDAIGNIQWQNTIGGSLGDNATIAKLVPDGGYIVGGYSFSDISGDKTENSRGGSDFWILKLDSVGNILWQKTIGGDGPDMLTSVVLTLDGGFLFSGTSDSNISGEKTENALGGEDFWIVKTDSLGNIQWQNTIGGNGNESSPFISIMNNGNYVLSGPSGSGISGDKTDESKGVRDYWVVMINSTGNIIGQKTIGGLERDDVRNSVATFNGGSIHLGYSDSDISGDKSENSRGGYWGDYWIVNIDSVGNILWQNTIGGSQDEIPNSVIETTEHDYLIGGSSNSNISEDKTENALGNYDYWVVKLVGNRNLIQGVEFVDLNYNNIQDIAEPSLTGKIVIENNTGKFAFTDQNGFYSLSVFDSGNFQVAPFTIPNYYTAAPSNYNIIFNSVNQVDDQNDFAVQPIGNFNDLCLTITPTGPFRSGFNASYLINYSNEGTNTINGTVVFYPDTNIVYITSSPIATTITLDSIIFSVGNLTPYQTGQILLTVSVNLGVPIGTTINSGATIFPIIGDVNPNCNVAYREVLTIGSSDPNDILVNINSLFSNQLPSEPELDYIIRFQNTGNDTAFTVKVLNPIDTTRLQLNSLEIVSSSHPMNASWIPWERNMQFKFDNIFLPDSNVNEPQSHGFVRYKIKPKTNLLVGDSINNQAHIYFDFNNPVATNIAQTDIILFTGIQEIGNSSDIFNVYPNPVRSLLNIQLIQSSQKNTSLEICSVFGQKIQTIEFGNSQENNSIKTIDISHLAAGVYFLKLEGHSSSVLKLVKY